LGLRHAIEEAKDVLRASHARFKPAPFTGKARRSSKRRRGSELLAQHRIAMLEREAARVKARVEGKSKEAKS
jgi:hypothetical protein